MVMILLAPGFEESEALVPADLLLRAGVEVQLVGVGGRCVTGSHGITVTADLTLEEAGGSDVEMLVLPGGTRGVAGLRACPAVSELILRVHGAGACVAAICAAPTLLSGLGLLEGRRAVCYPGMEGQLAGAQVQPGCPVVEDGPFITGEAAGASFPFGLKLVERLRGAQAAQAVRDAVHWRF